MAAKIGGAGRVGMKMMSEWRGGARVSMMFSSVRGRAGWTRFNAGKSLQSKTALQHGLSRSVFCSPVQRGWLSQKMESWMNDPRFAPSEKSLIFCVLSHTKEP